MLNRFFNWLGKQSLQRLFGVILGNTRELEAKIELLLKTHVQTCEFYQTTIQQERERFDKILSEERERFREFQDRAMFKEGIIPTTSPLPGSTEQPKFTPIVNLELESMVDRLKDLYENNPEEAILYEEDLLFMKQPHMIEAVKRYHQWLLQEAESEDREKAQLVPANIAVETEIRSLKN